MRLMQKFRISHKVALVAIAFAIPLLVVVALLFKEMRTEVAIAKDKQAAMETIRSYQSLQTLISKHRALAHLQLSGNKQLASQLNATQKQVDEYLENHHIHEDYKKSWQTIIQKLPSSKAPQAFSSYSKLIDDIQQHINTLANQTKLSLDSDLLTHELVDINLHSLTAINDKISVMAARGGAYIDSGLFEAGEDVMLNSLQMTVRMELKQAKEQLTALMANHPDYKDKFTDIDTSLTLASKFFDRAQDEVLASVNQSSGIAFNTAGQENINNISAQNDAVAALVNERLEQHINAIDAKIFRMFLAITLLILIAAYFLLAIYAAFTRDIRLLTASIEKTASGNLIADEPSTGKDELAQLINSVNHMKQGLSQLVENIRSSTLNIDMIALEIHEENTDLSNRTESQANSLQETASAVEELTSTTKENAGNLAQASSLVTCSAERVQQGLEVMGKAIDSMQTITASSRKISEIIGVMDGIAFQTNILALNAAVEAARAGQEGRGFAVVATEVRNLAQRSANAAKEIKHLIDSSGQAVEKGSTLINTAGKTMKEIADDVAQVTDLIRHVANASQEQIAGISNVNLAISSIDEITQHNASLVEQATDSTERLEQQAASLSTAVSVFKTAAESDSGSTKELKLISVNQDSTRIHHILR